MDVRTALLVLVAACGTSGSTGECLDDRDCATGDDCARDKMCTAPDAVRGVTTTWTIRGAAADATTCASHPDLYISFIGRDLGDTFGFAPVPCHLGRFFIDKLPTRYRQVELGVEGGFSSVRSIDANGAAAIDLR